MKTPFDADAIARAIAPWPTARGKAADIGTMAADRATDTILWRLSPYGRDEDEVYRLARAAAHFGRITLHVAGRRP